GREQLAEEMRIRVPVDTPGYVPGLNNPGVNLSPKPEEVKPAPKPSGPAPIRVPGVNIIVRPDGGETEGEEQSP
ncbi:MAG: hypothetical protein ABL958_11020, partial [Bdellovibrionia bacterium]